MIFDFYNDELRRKKKIYTLIIEKNRHKSFKSYKKNDYGLKLGLLITCNIPLFSLVGEVIVELKCHLLSLEIEETL
jgi:hypothetical protein